MSTNEVVVADDHAVMRDAAASLIARQPDMKVVGRVGNGHELVSLCASRRPHVAVVDLVMPFDGVSNECGGLEAVRRLREVSPSTRSVMLSMHDTPAHLRDALAAGAAGYVVKRDAGADLLEAIRQVHAGRSYVRVTLTDHGLEGVLRAPRPDGPGDADPLSTREQRVLELVALGYSNKEIATELGVSSSIVSHHRARIADKLGLRGRAAIVRYALETGVLARKTR